MKMFRKDLREGECGNCGNYDDEMSICCLEPESIYKKPGSWCRKWEKRPDGMREVQETADIKPISTLSGRLENPRASQEPQPTKKKQLPSSKPEEAIAT